MQSLLITVPIEEEMKKSYLDYAMSTIIGRALPDARDGLKPVHRRILFAMYEMGNTHDKPHKKSARVVGDVIGKYHPHGDQAVYEAIARMVQDFSMRYPLIDGQGNFGSVDGDEPAAMRYTEVRLSRIAEEMLKDIEKDTVGFKPNYDDSLKEPVVLPSRLPNLLINGSSGIAVGMATNIPPHNLREVIDGTIAYIEKPDITIDELLQYVKGPDFPTRGIIYGKGGIREAYEKGRGHIILRAKAKVETSRKDGRESIIITEIPYQVNKAKLIEDIAELVNLKKIDAISNIRDESNREGLRIVIELKKGEMALPVLNTLYKHTQLQTTFGIILLAVINNEPKVLNLKEIIREFVEFRREVVTKRTSFELTKASERLHILDGLRIALEHIDEVIDIIKRSKNRENAKDALISRFNFSERQATSILEMRLQRLTALEREKLIEEFDSTKTEIQRLEYILANEGALLDVIKSELLEIRNLYGDERLTEIVEETPEIKIEDMIKEEDVVIMLSKRGYIKRSSLTQFRQQSRGGKGRTGIVLKDGDFLEHIALASTHSHVLLITESGRAYTFKVHLIPDAPLSSKGKHLMSLINVPKEETITAIVHLSNLNQNSYLFLVTKRGMIKKINASSIARAKGKGIKVMELGNEDTIISAFITSGKDEIMIGTKRGMAIKFNEAHIREMGRNAYGVRGIRLKIDDEVTSADVVDEACDIFTVTEKGYGKRVPSREYRIQSRGGKGIKNLSCKAKNGNVLFIRRAQEEDEVILSTDSGKIIRFAIKDIPSQKRGGIGVKLMDLEEERITGIGVIRAES